MDHALPGAVPKLIIGTSSLCPISSLINPIPWFGRLFLGHYHWVNVMYNSGIGHWFTSPVWGQLMINNYVHAGAYLRVPTNVLVGC